MVTLAERHARSFWARVDKTSDCWLWTGFILSSGYGQTPFLVEGKRVSAHRLSYRMSVGDIPPGLTLDHLCRVRHCVRPDHLEAVTQQENLMRSESFVAINARKTHCVNGHEFTPENTYQTPRQRACRTCRADARKAWRDRNPKERNAA